MGTQTRAGWVGTPGATIDVLAGDEDLAAQVDADRLIGPDQAATRLEIRRTDFEYLLLGGLLVPATTSWMRVGSRRQVQVPLYRTSDVDALLNTWVRSTGTPYVPARRGTRHRCGRSPGRGHRPGRRRCAGGSRTDTTSTCGRSTRGSHDRWEIDWEMPDGHPTKDEVAAAIAADPQIAQYRDDLELSTTAGSATRWARRMLEPGAAAVILDTETTDLLDPVIIEVAVVDSAKRVGYYGLGPLTPPESTTGLLVPASARHVGWNQDVAEHVLAAAAGAPFLLQLFGDAEWRAAAPEPGGGSGYPRPGPGWPRRCRICTTGCSAGGGTGPARWSGSTWWRWLGT